MNRCNKSKKDIRKFICEYKKKYTSDELKSLSPEPLHLVEEMSEFKSAKTVLLYHSLPDEVDTHLFIKKWSAYKSILLPIIKENIIYLCKYHSHENLAKGAYNILEPQGEIFSESHEIDFALIPGIAFDTHKNRLGRGKGYYDKLLKSLECVKTGICFDFQLLDYIPTEEHDITMDYIIAGNKIIGI